MSKMPSRVNRQSIDHNQVDWEARKKNPRTRPVHAALLSGNLINPDPERKYTYSSAKPGEDLNYEYYQSIGYRVEKRTKDGVRIHQGAPSKEGEPLVWRGMVLLSCSKEKEQEIFLKGPSGSTGQEYQDRLYQKIRKGDLEKRSNVAGLIQNESWQDNLFRE